MLIKMERVPGLIWKWGGGVTDSALGVHLPRGGLEDSCEEALR